MDSIDLLATYFPAFEALTVAQVQDMRSRMSSLIHAGWPDIDYRPGSLLGDMSLTPMSYFLTAAEVAINRFASDLCQENVSKGIIYNCDFVREFLKNFAVIDETTLQSSGVVRLTFNADTEYEIDRRTQYQFNTDSTFQIRLAEDGPIYIHRVGVGGTSATNWRTLVDMGDGTFVADIPVAGTMISPVTAGTAGTTDYPISAVTTIAALSDFDSGLPASSLPILAQKTQQTFYSNTPNTRGGAARFLQKEFPQLVGVSPVLTGDPEMVRDSLNALGFGSGMLDLYVRSNATVVETQTIKVPYIASQGTGGAAHAVNFFIAPLLLTNVPYKIDSVVALGAPKLALPLGSQIVIFSQSGNSTRLPMSACSYSLAENLWITSSMPLDPTTSADLIPLEVDNNGQQYANFQITYRYDPLLRPVIDAMSSSDAGPPGIDTTVRGFVPVVIDSLTVNYNRKRGSAVNVDGARAEILAYVNNLALPVRFSSARIGDSMYYAGAADLVDLYVRAHVQWSVAHRLLPYGVANPAVDYVAALAGSLQPHTLTISNARGLTPFYRDINIGTSNATYEAIGQRNVLLILDDANLTFSEHATV